MIGRIAVLDVSPSVSCGRWPVKLVTGEVFPVLATVFREGHDLVGATAVAQPAGPARRGGAPARGGPPVGSRTRAPGAVRAPLRLVEPGLDRWQGELSLPTQGSWTLTVEGWADPIATWRHGIEAKLAAGQDVELELEEGARLFDQAAAERIPAAPRGRAGLLGAVAAALRDPDRDAEHRLAAATDPRVVAMLAAAPLRALVSASEPIPVRVERERALVGSWYELFPRSEGGLAGATERLEAVAGMGFDVVYLPPIHPIGTSFRKGPNNTLEPGPDDPGSPWAIGSELGGHDTVDPGLGTVADLARFVDRASELGMEVALDLALQASPDHPWVREHPDWFLHRADGSIAYAENPPKRYQDIYPIAFDTDPDGIHAEVLRLVRQWRELGIRIFRVDNPHTKPLPFWERLIAEVQAEDPDAVFLAEAFTRPPMMHALAKIGFTQSYTYFTWRTEREEIEEYLTDLTTSPTADYMRPNLWVNTPDILHAYLQYGGPPAFRIRAVLAATLCPSWGVYSGYELFEHEAVRPGSEEYLDSEKFQVRRRDWSHAEQLLAPYLRRLNEVRREHPALRRLRGLTFHRADNRAIIAYSRRVGADTVLTVVNLDPHSVQETTVSLELAALGDPPSGRLAVHDQLGARETYEWSDRAYVRLDPFVEPAHVFVVTAA